MVAGVGITATADVIAIISLVIYMDIYGMVFVELHVLYTYICIYCNSSYVFAIFGAHNA